MHRRFWPFQVGFMVSMGAGFTTIIPSEEAKTAFLDHIEDLFMELKP